MILLIGLANVLFRFVLPIKPIKVISESMAPTYNAGDVIFYSSAKTYNIDDIIIYNPSTRPQSIVVRIIEKNADDTFKVKGDNAKTNPAPIKQLNQEAVKADQIIGKVSFGTKGFIFYPLSYGIQILVAFLLTQLIYSKLKR
ncbi:MAG: signal peptidase I [Nanoarchaeota archaeon]|nr:signal peptidase I [Nanoarchaeota archaeon]